MTRARQLAAFADQDPRNTVLLCDLFDELLHDGEQQAVLDRLAHVAPDLAALPELRFRAARAAMQGGDFEAALAVLRDLARDLSPMPAGVVHDLAYVQVQLGQPAEALQALDGFSPVGDDVVAFALLRARAFHHMRRHRDALDVLEPFMEGVRGAEVRGLRALLWLDDDNRAQAVREARQALQKDPAQHEAAIVEATLALWEQRLDESADVFGQVLVRHPDSGRALLGLGQERMLRGDVAAGRTLIERATKVMPDHLGTWHAFAWCQLIEGDLAGARASFEHALAVDRTFGETHGGLALVHALRSERTEAEASIRRAMRLDPNGRTARYARSVLLLDEGLVDEARAEVAQLMTLSPGIGVAISADFIFRLRELVRPRG